MPDEKERCVFRTIIHSNITKGDGNPGSLLVMYIELDDVERANQIMKQFSHMLLDRHAENGVFTESWDE